MNNTYDTVIIGGGTSGLAAAMYSGRFLMKTAMIYEKKGGTVILTDDISNYPGFRKIRGLDLIKKMVSHVKDYDAKLIEDEVKKIEKNNSCFRVITNDKKFVTKTIIITTGTEIKKLGVRGEEKYLGRGVHYCALCDGTFYKDKVIGVVGGSDSAAKEALLLAEYGKKVYIICKGENIKPEPIHMKQIKENKKIEIIPNTNVIEIKGKKYVNSAVLDKSYKGKRTLKLDALFIEIGHTPKSELAKKIGIKLNEKNEIIIDKEGKTNIEGIYAAGDVTNTRFKQAITGAAEGVTAAYSAYQHVNNGKAVCIYDEDENDNV